MMDLLLAGFDAESINRVFGAIRDHIFWGGWNAVRATDEEMAEAKRRDARPFFFMRAAPSAAAA